MFVMSLLIGLAASADDLDARRAVLNKHLDRLDAITVPAPLRADKQTKLDALREQLARPAETPERINQLYLEMDQVRSWLWAHAEDRPRVEEGAFSETDDAWTLDNHRIKLTLDKADLSVTVTTPQAAWQFAPCDENDIRLARGSLSFKHARDRSVEPFRTAYSTGMLLTLANFPTISGQRMILGFHLTGHEVQFTLTAPGDLLEFETIQWPKPIRLGKSPDDLSVIPFMQGMLLPGNYDQEIHRKQEVHSRTWYMPWFGQIHQGRGVLAIFETDDDAGGAYTHPPGGPTVIEPLWYASMRTLRYPRSARYVFDDNATYVTLAKRYRRYVKEAGRFVSLDEKRVRTPNLDKVIGRPVVHIGALYHNVEQSDYQNKTRLEANHALTTFDEIADQLRGLKAKGIDQAYVHLDGWGYYGYDNGHPDPLPPGPEQGGWDGLRKLADACDAMDWIFAVHDQYRDFYYTAASYHDDLALRRQDTTRPHHAKWCGGPQSLLSAAFAPGCVRRNHDLFAAHGIKVRGAYLDVFAIVPLEESYHDAHPMTRTDCAEYRARCFNLLRARGYVVSSEEPVDRFVPDLDLVHHGPYNSYGSRKLTGIPVPLFNLVYHDAILLPWAMSEKGGWGVPPDDAGWLHCLLNAGLPYVHPNATPKQIERVRLAADLARRCATLEMTHHEFLDDTHRKQRTTFADHTQVTVDFDQGTYTIKPQTP